MITLPKELLSRLLFSVVGERCTTRSYNRQAIECGDCGVYNDEDGWSSIIEHKYDCKYTLNKEAKEELMLIMNNEVLV